MAAYLDHAACGWPRPAEVVEAVADAMARAGNAGRGATGPSRAADEIVGAAREEISSWLGVGSPSRVGFFLNATDALNQAIHGLVAPGARVLATRLEHNSVLRPLYASGARVEWLPLDASHRVDLNALPDLLADGAALVAVHHASNLLGIAQDIASIAFACRSRGVPLLVDASQSAGVLDIDMAGSGMDLVAFSGHKGLYGPTGVGVLCVGEGVKLRPLRQGGTGGFQSDLVAQPAEMPWAVEAGTLNVVGIAGLLAAVRWIRGIGPTRVRQHVFGLTRRLLASLVVHENVTVYESSPDVGVVSFNLDGWEPAELARVLEQSFEVGVAAGLLCAPEAHRLLGTFARGGVVRASMGIRSREAEVDALSDAMERLAAAEVYSGEQVE